MGNETNNQDVVQENIPIEEIETQQQYEQMPPEEEIPFESYDELIPPEQLEAQKRDAKLDRILEILETKVKVDEHKNKMFDNMHQELCSYRNGVLEKNTNAFALDLIGVIDSYEKQYAMLNDVIRPDDEEYTRLLDTIKNVIQDMIDVLYRQGIEPFTSIDEDMIVDVKSQKIVKTVNTVDESLNNKICSQIAPGYAKGDNILRAEKISIYKYVKE